MRWLDGVTNSMNMILSKLWEIAKEEKTGMLQSMGSQRVGHNLVTEQQLFCQETGDTAGSCLKKTTQEDLVSFIGVLPGWDFGQD